MFLRVSSCAECIWTHFSEKSYRKKNTAVWEDSLVPDLYVSTQFPICQKLERRCSKNAFAKQWLLVADFSDD